jgi:hypothetical protein
MMSSRLRSISTGVWLFGRDLTGSIGLLAAFVAAIRGNAEGALRIELEPDVGKTRRLFLDFHLSLSII